MGEAPGAMKAHGMGTWASKSSSEGFRARLEGTVGSVKGMFFRSTFSVLPDPREGQACRGAEVVPQGSAQTEVALGVGMPWG